MKQVLFAVSPATATGTVYTSLMGEPSAWGTEVSARAPWPCAGVFRNLVVDVATVPTTGTKHIFILRVNGVSTTLQVVLDVGQATGRLTGVDVAVAAGDLVALQHTAVGSPTATAVRFAVEFEGTGNESGYVQALGPANQASGNPRLCGCFNATQQNLASGAIVTNVRNVVAAAGSLTGLWVATTATVAAGNGYTFYVNKNGVRQDGTAGSVNTATAHTDGSAIVARLFTLPVLPGDIVYLEAVPTGTFSQTWSVGVRFAATTAGQAQVGGAFSFASGTTQFVNAVSQTGTAGGTTETTYANRAIGGVTPVTLSGLQVLASVVAGGSASRALDLRLDGLSPGPAVTLGSAALSGSDVTRSAVVREGQPWGVRSVPTNTPAIQVLTYACIASTVPPTLPTAPYRDAVLASAPYAYWRLGESAGSTVGLDSSGNGHTLSLLPGVTLGFTGALKDDSDKSALFDGSANAKAATTDNALGHYGATAITFEAWVKNPTWSGGHEMIVSCGNSGGTYLSVQAGNLFLSLQLSPQRTAKATTVLPPAAWLHVAGVWSSGSPLQVYVNGVAQPMSDTTPYSGSLVTGDPNLFVGSFAGSSLFTSGWIDEAAIYLRALPATEIATHYALGGPRDYDEWVVADGASDYWRLGELSGTTAFPTVGTATFTVRAFSLNQPGPIGDGNPAMRFNADTLVSSVPVTIGPTASVEVWFKQAASVTGYAALLSTRDAGATAGNLFVGLNDSGFLEVLSTGGASINGTKVVRDDQWHHLVVAFTGTTALIYLDGVLDKTGAFARAAASALPLGLGFDPVSSGLNWNGLLDEPAIYPRTLSAADVAVHYAAASGNVASFLRSPWFAGMLEDDMGMQSYNACEAVTPSDTVNFSRTAKGLWVGGGGNVAVVLEGAANPVVFTAVPAGAWLPLAVKRVHATGTTATGILALGNV